jgi:hypothetical protein
MAEEPYDPDKHGPLRGSTTGTATAPGMSLGDQPYDPAAHGPLRGEMNIPAPPAAPPDPQMEGWYRMPAMGASQFAKGTLEGVGGVGDLQGLIQRYSNQYINDPIRYALGLRDPVTPRDLTGKEMFYPGAGGQSIKQLFPGATPDQLPDYLKANRAEMGTMPMRAPVMSSPSLLALGNQLGVTDRPDLKPQNAPERYLSAVAEGTGAALPYLATGGGIPGAIRGLAVGGAGGAGGELASEYSDSPWARAGGAVAGALTAGSALSATGKVINAARGVGGPVISAADRLGIPVNLTGDMTGNTGLQQLQAYSTKSAGGAGRMADVGTRTMRAFDDAVENTASNLGTARTAEQAGTVLGMEERAWVNNFQTRQKTAWAPVDMYLPQTTTIPATNYANTLTAISKEIPTYSSTAEALQQPLTRKLLDSLITDSAKGPPTVADLRGIRTKIGEMLGEPVIAGDTNRVELQRLWGALSQDIEAMIATKGPKAQAAFAEASKVSREGHQFVDNVLSKVAQGTESQPTGRFAGQAAETALSTGGAGGQFLQAIRDEMPAAADALAAYKLRNMAGLQPGRPNPSGINYSPNHLLTESHPNNLSPEAHAALFGHDPYVTRQLSDLNTVAMPMRNTERFVNFSNTAPTQQISSIFQKADYGALPFNWLASRVASSPTVSRLFEAPSALPGGRAARLGTAGSLDPWLRPLTGQ